MLRKRADQCARRGRSIGKPLFNASEVEKLAYKQKHIRTRNESREDDENMSNLNYGLCSYGDLLIKATKPIRGQKQLLKRLYLDVNEILEKCTVNELRHAVYEPYFITSLEGKKLAAHFIPKIGADKFWMLVKRVVTSGKTSRIQCVNYGEVLLLAWKNAVKDGIHNLQYRLERIFMDIVYYALQHLHYNKKFMAMLESFGKTRNKQIDAMIYRTFEPNLWRCLKAANETVRFNACCLFLPFYPFISDDDIENVESINMQQGIIVDLLKDDSYGIRSEACRRTLFILSAYFDTFPLNFIKQCLTQIIDDLSVDSNVNVRIAVYEGMCDLLHCGSALNACERALKCLFDNRGINDRCEHVRLSAFQLLNALVGHRFIKLSEVIKMDRILKVFAAEESIIVRKEIAKLLLPSYAKPGLSPDEVIRRIIVMGRDSEVAALSFHHIIVAENLMTVEHAVQHAKSLVLAVYKALRSLEGIDGCEIDEAMSICSEVNICETFIEPIQDKILQFICIIGQKNQTPKKLNEASGKFELWHSSHLLLNCLVVMWLPLRLILDDEKYAKENENLRRLLTKLFKFAFLHYRNTSILEAMMHLGKTLDDWKEGRILVLQELLQNYNLDDEKATVYLEAASSWNFLALLKFIDDVFETVKREVCNDSPPKKREKRSNLPNNAFNRSLLCLDRIVKQPEIKYQLEHNYAIYVSKYYEALTSLRQLIIENILQKRFRFFSFTLSFESIICGIRMQYILAVMSLTGNEKGDDKKILINMQDDVKWLKESVMPQILTNLTDEQLDMMIKVCETYICLWTQQLRTYNTPFAFREALCDVQWIDNIKKGHNAVRLLPAVIALFRNLIITAAVTNEMTETVMASLLVSIFKYVTACSKSKFAAFDSKKIADSWLSIYNTLNSCKLLTSEIIAEHARIIADCVLKELLEINENAGNIQRPLDLCLEVNEVIDFWINKVLLKHQLLRCSVFAYLKDQIENRVLFANIMQDEIIRSGAVIQFLKLLRNSTKKISNTSISNSMRKCTNMYEACMRMLNEHFVLLLLTVEYLCCICDD
ncbi:Condensin-2 complex subunit [Dirofilaria immitis]